MSSEAPPLTVEKMEAEPHWTSLIKTRRWSHLSAPSSGILSTCEGTSMPNMESILRDHTTLQVECIDRLYFCSYVPRLQRANQLAYFLNGHRGKPFPSPALLNQMTERFVAGIKAFATQHRIPIVHFKPGERKDDIAKRYIARFRGREGVVLIGVAQESANVFRGKPHRRKNGSVAAFKFFRTTSAAVNQSYFYVLDPDWGPAFVKVSSYAPFTGRVCLNGHEWATCQLRRAGIAFEALDHGFRSCAAPERLQAGSAPPTSTPSSIAGLRDCRTRSPARTGTPAIDTACRSGRWNSV